MKRLGAHQNRCLVSVGLGLALIAVSCIDQGSGSRPAGKLVALSPCQLSSPGFPSRVEAECGFVAVPEDWSKPSERQIRLHVAVIPAEGDRSSPDPLFFFAGGPGQAATESFVTMAAAFEKIGRSRDIVLIDQRGTGRSHPLRCEPPAAESPYEDLSPEAEEAWLRACIASLEADLAQFTTVASIRDFDHVRAALGYEQINLYGISYGTRVALSYLRAYQDRVRSVVLDGVVPQGAVLGPTILVEGPRRTKEATLRRCKADPSCNQHFPNLAEEFSALEAVLRADPPTVEVLHPRTGHPVRAKLSWQGWSLTLRMLGYASETVALLPLLVHTAHESKDYGPLLAQAILVVEMLQGAISSGLEYTVLCGEEWPFFAKDDAGRGETLYGARELDSLARICEIWPHEPVAASFKEPVRSNVPTLILSGEIDPVTPPADGEVAAKTLSRSLHVVVPGQGHGVVTRGCLPDQVAEFIEAASLQGVDTACVATIKPLRFFVDFAGPVP